MTQSSFDDTRAWVPDPSPTGGGRHAKDAGDRLRSGLQRISLVSVVVVALISAAGVSAVVMDRSLGMLATICVAAVSVLVLLVAAGRTSALVTGFRERQRTDVDATIHLMTGPQPATAHEAAYPVFGEVQDQRREVFVKLARRLQSLINRAIRRVDELEQEIEDPDLLKGLYEVDHLATRVRRQAENLAVLGGEAPQRRSNNPISVYAVLRSAVAEIEHYKQVSIMAIEEVNLRGHAVAEIVHLLAELLENATNFTAPNAPKVVLRAQRVTAGLAIEVEDRGLGMPAEDQQRINHLLDGSAVLDIGDLLRDGRIGLAVVAELARRHGIRVQLRTNIFGGTDAVVVLPHALFGDPPQETETQQSGQVRRETRTDLPAQPAQPARVPAVEPAMSAVPAASSPAWPPAERYREPVAPRTSLSERLLPQEHSVGAPDDPLPVLPVREPGTSFVVPDMPAAANSADPHFAAEYGVPPTPLPSSGAEPYPTGEYGVPPLPQRRGQSHLRPELLAPVAPTRPMPGHNPSLMATFREGLERGLEAGDGESADQSGQPQSGSPQSHQGITQGGSRYDR